MAQAFFNPTSPFGDLAGWEVQTENPTTSKQRAQALGSDGDEIASQTYDEKTTVNATYTATSDTAAIPKVGAILGGYHIDSVALAFSNTAFVQMTLTGHKHGSTAHPACRTYTGSYTALTNKFGCPSDFVGVTIPPTAGIRSIGYNLTVNHTDELGNAGNFLAADNYDATETVDVEACDSSTLTNASGWDTTSSGQTLGNTAAETSSITVEHHLSHDAS